MVPWALDPAVNRAHKEAFSSGEATRPALAPVASRHWAPAAPGIFGIERAGDRWEQGRSRTGGLHDCSRHQSGNEAERSRGSIWPSTIRRLTFPRRHTPQCRSPEPGPGRRETSSSLWSHLDFQSVEVNLGFPSRIDGGTARVEGDVKLDYYRLDTGARYQCIRRGHGDIGVRRRSLARHPRRGRARTSALCSSPESPKIPRRSR